MFGSLTRLFSHVSARRRWQLAGLLVLMLAGAAAEMATLGAIVPFLTLLVDTQAVGQHPVLLKLLGGASATPAEMVRRAAIVFALVAVLSAAVRTLLFWASYRFTFGLGSDIGGKVYLRTLHSSYSWHVSRNTSEILAGVEKVNTVTNSVIVQVIQGGVASVICVAILTVLLLIDAAAAMLAGGCIAALYGITSAISRHRLRRNAVAIATNRTNRIRSVQEGLGGIRDVLLDGTQGIYHRRFAVFDSGMRRAQAGNAFISASPRVIMEAAGVVLIMALAYGMSLQPGGLIHAVPVLGALALGAQKLLPQVQNMYHAWSAIMGSRRELEDVLALLELPGSTQTPPTAGSTMAGARADQPHRPLIALRDVSFRYRPEGPPVLESIQLEVPLGARIGVVGTTGSGKSTLLDLVMGLLVPSEGVIEIQGEPLTAQTLRTWQTRIAHVPQMIYLGDASIAENVAMGDPHRPIEMDLVERVARQAQLTEFVEGLPQRYDTSVGERGIRLSGGQRQRIGLARALYKQAEVLILDEATSALDDTTEQEVMSAIDALPGNLTIFMVAHRLTTVQGCDRLLLLEKGRIVGFDSWDALAARNPAFQAFAKITLDGRKAAGMRN